MIRSILLLTSCCLLLSSAAAQETTTDAGSNSQQEQSGKKSIVLNGICLAEKGSPMLIFSPEYLTEAVLLNVQPHGKAVKKGESIAAVDMRPINDLIEQWEDYVESAELRVARLSFEAEQLKLSSEMKIRSAKDSLKKAEEDLEDFLGRKKERMIAVEDNKVDKVKRALYYKEVEIKQLSQMYAEDQVAAETEEIIMTRIKNDLSDAKFNLAGEEQAAFFGKTRTIPRHEKHYRKEVENARFRLENEEGTTEFDLQQKSLDLAVAKKSLEKSRKKLEGLKKDREMVSFKSPIDGILVWGGYNGEKWDSQTASAKLKAGGKLFPYDVVATILPAEARFVVEAVLPDSPVDLKVGAKTKIRITGQDEVEGTVTQVNSIPCVDGKRRVKVALEERVFSPGSGAEVVVY